MKEYGRIREIASIVLQLRSSIEVVNFTPPTALPPGMKPGTHRARGWRGPSICVGTLERRKCFVPAEILARLTQLVTWSQISDMSERAIHCVVLRAHAYWNITLPPIPNTALRLHLIPLYLYCKKKWLQIKFVRLLHFHSIFILFHRCTPRISALFDHLTVPFTWDNRDSTVQYSIPAPSSTCSPLNARPQVSHTWKNTRNYNSAYFNLYGFL